MDINRTSQTIYNLQYPELDDENFLTANGLEALESLIDESSKMDIDGLPRENLLDSVLELSKKRELPLPESFYSFMDKVARKEETSFSQELTLLFYLHIWRHLFWKSFL